MLFDKKKNKKVCYDKAVIENRSKGLEIFDYEIYLHRKKVSTLNTIVILGFTYLTFFLYGLIVGLSIMKNTLG